MPVAAFQSYLVSPKELSDALDSQEVAGSSSLRPKIVPLCAAWFLSADGRKGINCFLNKRIRSSRFFDLDAIADHETHLPHMLPSNTEFGLAMGALGIAPEDTIVVYDTEELGIFSAPRVAWTLRVFNHLNVHVLDNFRLWVQQGYSTVSGDLEEIHPVSYGTPTKNCHMVIDFEQLRNSIVTGQSSGVAQLQILDTRAFERWSGQSPELHAGLANGHMPFSLNVPLSNVLDQSSRSFRPPADLRETFRSKGVKPAMPVVMSCGSGITAAVLETALLISGYLENEACKLYDGSWREWGQRAQLSKGLIQCGGI